MAAGSRGVSKPKLLSPRKGIKSHKEREGTSVEPLGAWVGRPRVGLTLQL